MSRSIRIKNFGPINGGLSENDGFIDVKKITIFIGNQGSGKSSVTKLISIMSWLEKSLYRGELKESYVTSYNRFVNEFCNYQNLKNYFRPDTDIKYIGDAYTLEYKEGKLSIEASKTNGYKVPKIMYVPAERNFLSAVENPDKLKGLPKALFTFWEEMQRSLQELSGSLSLPVGNARFEYDKSNKIPRIIGPNYKLRLSEASSGFQSFVPLYLVSRSLALSINKKRDTSRNEMSSEEQRRLKTEIEKILKNDKLSEELKEVALELLSSKYRNDSFLNIVEEIEQNLFPSSQKDILFSLFGFVNNYEGNGLVLTTHSPYVISYLSLAIQGGYLQKRISEAGKTEELKVRLATIVPLESCILKDSVIVYQLNDHGDISILPDYEGIPSDKNYLNDFLKEGNELFDQLLEIEEEL